MASIPERWATEVSAQMADPTVVHIVGQAGLHRHDQQRRVVWVPGAEGSRVEPTKQMGGKVNAGGTDVRGVQVYSCLEKVEIHIYAETAELVEILFRNVLAAISLKFGPNIETPWPYSRTTERRDEQGENVWQSKILLLATISFPALNEIAPLTTATTQGHTGIFIGANGPEVVC